MPLHLPIIDDGESADGDHRTFALPERLTNGEAPGLKAALRSLRGQPLSIDASQVEQLDTLCAQTLLAAKNLWANESLGFVIDMASTNFRTDADLLGLHDLLWKD